MRSKYGQLRNLSELGLILAAACGLLIYRTWTFVFVAISFLGLPLRARQEEQALAAEFGEGWQACCHRVPGWIPHILRLR